MRTRPLKRYGVVLLSAVLLAAMAGVASSVDVPYTLRVGSDNVVMPDNAVIPVWKIADVGLDNVLRFPGPTLVGTVGDNLVVTLVNGLPVDNTSTVGPGTAYPSSSRGFPCRGLITRRDRHFRNRDPCSTTTPRLGRSRSRR